MKRILFSPQMEWLPILKSLKGKAEFIGIHAGFIKQAQDLDIPVLDLSSSTNPIVNQNAGNLAAKLLKDTLSQPISLDGLHPAVNEAFQNNLGGFLYQRVGDLSLLVLALDEAKPDLIVLHNDVEPIMRTLALWAKTRQVPCLHIPHAVYLPHADRGGIGSDVHDLVTASHLAVASEWQSQWYIDRGMLEDHIHMTGLPQFDRWAYLRPDRNAARERLGLRLDRPVISYASSWRQNTNLMGCHEGVEESYLAFLEAAKEGFSDFQLVIKLHPRNSGLEWHLQEAQKAGVDCLVTALHLELVLSASDMLISFGPSNVLLEASFVPWLRLAAINGFEQDEEVLTLQPQVEDIRIKVLECLAKPPIPTIPFRESYLGKIDGHAAQNISQWIEEGFL